MKKKILTSLLMGAFLFASTSMIMSCKDYDDDINNLQAQIDKNTKAIEGLTTQLQNGGVITSVDGITNGVKVTLSNGKTFEIKNGEDGEDGINGTVWTISDDGFWVQDGVKTDKKALGSKGEDGAPGTQWTISEDGFWVKDGTKTTNKAIGKDGSGGAEWTISEDGFWVKDGQKTNKKAVGTNGTNGEDGKDGAPGKYYEPNSTTGKFDVYTWDAAKNEYVKTATDISFLAPGTITAVMDNQNLKLSNVKGVNGGQVVLSLSGYLTSLVFMPKLYLDGIETIEYPWLQDTIMKQKPVFSDINRQQKVVRNLVDYVANYLPNKPEAGIPTDELFSYGPAWGVQYHLNPSNAAVAYGDIVGFNVLQPEVLYMNTRGSVQQPKITSPEKNAAGNSVFMTSNGILTAGIQIDKPELLNPNPTALTVNENDYTVALQVKSKTIDGETATITSDYALLLPTRTYLEALIWNKKPMYAGAAKEGTTAATSTREGDELGIFDADKQIHVWDSPQEALQDPDGAALELYYNSAEGITISDYLGIHYVKEVFKTTSMELGTWKYGDEKAWGLSYEFNLIDYSIDGNETHDSKYAKWVDQSKGQIRAWNVKDDGTTIDTESATSVDREPLVQVLVKNNAGQVVLDGYILIHITKVNPEKPEQPNKTIDTYPAGEAEFNLCDGEDVLETNWSQFSYFILTQGLNNMEKDEFDEYYEPDLKSIQPAGTTTDGYEYFDMNIFTEAKEKGDATPENPALGNAFYYPNSEGTTNHRFKWTLSAEELEKITHDQSELPVKITRYIRFKAKSDEAPYPYVYVKMEAKVTRAAITSKEFGKKNEDYWFGLDGKDAGWDAIVFDVNEPIDGNDIMKFNREINNSLLGNVPAFGEDEVWKYYFAPKNVTITALNGKTYTITAQSSATDANWNMLYCKYITTPNADKHEWKEATLDKILTDCAIDYTKGAFNNTTLYAKEGTTYTKIASLNEKTGEIQLEKNDQCKDVLNAIGYAPNHSNINTEMRTWVSVITQGDCGLAEIVKHEKASEGLRSFLVSWQRPINLKAPEDQIIVDANTNGNVICLLDFLKLFDWRGEDKGYMWGDQQWFWAFYNVKAITVDVNPQNVLTNMHYGGACTHKLADVTEKAELYSYPQMKQVATTYNFSLYPTYDSASQNDALLSFMGISPEDQDKKAQFGALYYENNGENVEEFDLLIPITIEYEWGKFEQKVKIHINRTLGH